MLSHSNWPDQIISGTAAAHCCQLRVGQKILAVNGISMVGISHDRAVQVLKEAGNRLSILINHGYEEEEEEEKTSTRKALPYATMATIDQH